MVLGKLRQTSNRARRPKTKGNRVRTCVACRQTKPTEALVRYAASGNGEVRVGAIGGRGAWLCDSGNEAHEALIAEGLRRGLRGNVSPTNVEQIISNRSGVQAKGGSR
ncbi:MAG: YlxR family protein [Candidatus Limnocylindrus sp.]